MIVIAFDSTHAALAAQDLLAGLKIQLIPTPRTITADCGMSIRVADDEVETARMRLNERPDIASLSSWHELEK